MSVHRMRTSSYKKSMILISILNVVSITQLQCSIRILNLSNADDSLFNVLNMDSQYVTKSRLASSGTVGPKSEA